MEQDAGIIVSLNENQQGQFDLLLRKAIKIRNRRTRLMPLQTILATMCLEVMTWVITPSGPRDSPDPGTLRGSDVIVKQCALIHPGVCRRS